MCYCFKREKKDEKTIDKMPFVNYSEAATSVFGASPPFGAAASCLLASAAAGSAVVSLAAPSSALSLASPASLAVSPVFSLVDSFFLSFFSFFSFFFLSSYRNNGESLLIMNDTYSG